MLSNQYFLGNRRCRHHYGTIPQPYILPTSRARCFIFVFCLLSLTHCVLGVALRYAARLLYSVSPVSTAPNRSYTVEDFTDLINSRLQQLERRKEAQQRFGTLLVVLRQQVDAYRQRRTAG